ncbi:MAG: DegT/DnrJ/EryC1/StrS family aminotransferase [Oscillospiraceae bacterium]|nr:DegT/DnrJ/EryC1/StrS family aminotransferase [Oscillospiraceae bacterium]
MKIPSNDLKRQFLMYKDEYEKKAVEVLNSGWYVLGAQVSGFEKEFAEYTDAKYCVGVASGLDALIIAVRALGVGKGDEVLVPANTYIATVMGITICGATPVFVEPDEYYNIDVSQIEARITERTKAVMSVNLYGQSCQMDKLREISKKRGIFLIEDCAQSHGSRYHDRPTTTYADVSCYSFYPSKNLGAFGEGGAIVTNMENVDRQARMIRNYGSQTRYHNEVVGMNSRLDELQAGLLRVKLGHLDEITQERRRLAETYLSEIVNDRIILPSVRKNATSVWHLFVVRTENRDAFLNYMGQKGVNIIVHYPIPPHLSQAYAYLGFRVGSMKIAERYAQTVATLPLYNGMTAEEQNYVVDTINNWRGQ